MALGHIGVDQASDNARNLVSSEGRADHGAEAGVRALLAADGDLIPLRAILVDAEDADVADMVMAAGVHAPRNVEFELADVVQVIKVVKGLLDGLRDRDALRIGQRAEIAPWTADDVGEQADIGRGQAVLASRLPERVQLTELDIGEDEVLLVRDADLAETEPVGKLGDGVHLHVSGVARRDTRGL